MLKILHARLQQYMNWEIPDVQAEFRKGEEPEINFQHPLDHRKSKRVPEKHLFLLYWLGKNLWLCGPPQTVENSERDGNTRPPDRETYMKVRKQQLELDMEQQTGSK